MGATNYTTSSSKEKLDECKKLGADMLINYKEAKFLEIVRSKANPDAVLEVSRWVNLESASVIWCRGRAKCCFADGAAWAALTLLLTGQLGLSVLGIQPLLQACHGACCCCRLKPWACLEGCSRGLKLEWWGWHRVLVPPMHDSAAASHAACVAQQGLRARSLL